MANTSGPPATKGGTVKGNASGVAVSHDNSTGEVHSVNSPPPNRERMPGFMPPVHRLPNAMPQPNNEGHHPNGEHRATNSKMGDC